MFQYVSISCASILGAMTARGEWVESSAGKQKGGREEGDDETARMGSGGLIGPGYLRETRHKSDSVVV